MMEADPSNLIMDFNIDELKQRLKKKESNPNQFKDPIKNMTVVMDKFLKHDYRINLILL